MSFPPIDFLIYQVMLPLVKLFHSVPPHNWGLDIVLLTVTVKLVVHPLTAKAIRSSLTMQKLAPQLKDIQERYKNNPEKLRESMMDFYKKNQFNPLAGCLPMLLQMPILIALYLLLISPKFAEMVKGTTFLGISSLTKIGVVTQGIVNIDIIILIILFGVTTFLSQRIITKLDDPMQRQMLYMMPILITFMFTFFPIPSGALLYMVTSNTFTVFQYLYLKRTFPAYEKSKEARRSKMAELMETYEKRRKDKDK